MIEDNIPVSVLIVDDNPAKRTALAAALEGMDVGIVTATSGTEALRKLMAQDFAAVLLDVNMPIMDGFETAEMIRRRPRSEHLPILFITAERFTDDARLQGYGLGAVDYILSPILPQILRSKVAVFADLYRLREQIARQNLMLKEQVEQIEARNAELRQSESWFRAVFNSQQDAVFVTTAEGLIINANFAVEKIFGYPVAELKGQVMALLQTDEQRYTEEVKRIQQAVVEDTAIHFEHELRRKNGGIFLSEYTLSPMKSETGTLKGVVRVIRDITERKRIEEENHLMLAMGKALAEAEDFASALAISIRAICENADWDFGEVWIPSHDGTHLELGSPYYCMNEEVRSFRGASEKFEFAPGVGLPGRVWASGKPVWIPDVTVDANFPRAPFAKQAGIRAAVAIPIMSGNMVVAVMNFFMRKSQAEDERMTTLISAVAAQLGTAFQRKRDAERIQRLVNFDALTGLPNRILLTDRISQVISMAQQRGLPVGKEHRPESETG